jgi:hypothetical protein
MPLSHAICQILNLFCKVRGEKVIKGFLNNEPRYLEPILDEFEKGGNFVRHDGSPLPQSILPWTERYLLLLWLSHLMLAPFPLASMSDMHSSRDTSAALGLDLPSELPDITLRSLKICIHGLRSATKERGAAANLLVRLCIRPDMQQRGLLDVLVKWALSFFRQSEMTPSEIHQYLGVLSFLAGLMTSATNEEIGPFLPAIYQTCLSIIRQETLASVKSSAVARKLVIKTLRNIVVHCLQAPYPPSELDTTVVLEEVIEFLLEALSDGDTPVRYAASKALSVVTMKLEPEMAEEVVDAILDSLSENVYWQGPRRNLSGVNPLQWHGLTLTLSHLLYRKVVAAAKLTNLLNALFLALAFEQRSATGGSIGTNVRDAACFGIWALARRYTTQELVAVETSSVRAAEHLEGISILQVLAIELLVVACLDPAGNIRRGSSAALQELIGRHPDVISEGIPLVQVVDFHAVGLRERAMCHVAVKAAALDKIYWEALFENVLGWRGTGSIDAASRLYAASVVGLLSAHQTPSVVVKMADEVSARLKALKPREIEERQGLVMSLAALVDNTVLRSPPEEFRANSAWMAGFADLTYLWELLDDVLNLEDGAFTSPALRPAFTASTMCYFLGALSTMSSNRGQTKVPATEICRLLNLCLTRHESSVLEAIPRATRGVLELLSRSSGLEMDALVSNWLTKLENEASYNGLRCSGYAIALGAAHPLLSTEGKEGGTQSTEKQDAIVKVLTFRCTAAVAVEARTMALKALDVLLTSYQDQIASTPLPKNAESHIGYALQIALNDYTVTERGDVGSLVRLEALTTTGTAWSLGMMKGPFIGEKLHADVIRLSLEKLDKMRTRAAYVLEQGAHEEFGKVANSVADGTSSYTYFSNALKVLQSSSPDTVKEALCLGFASSAGMGSESVVQNSRTALLDTLDSMPTSPAKDTNDFDLLDMANCLVNLTKKNLSEDRVLLPLLEVIAFLFDMQVLQRLAQSTFKYDRDYFSSDITNACIASACFFL